MQQPHQIPTGFFSKNEPRVPSACIQCRTRHVRCDGVTPICSRCQKEGKTCVFAKSRRGGRPRAAPAQPGTTRSQPVHPPDHTQRKESTYTTPDLDKSQSWSLGDSMSPTLSLSGDSRCVSEHGGSPNQLLVLYYHFFHRAHPCALPYRSMKKRLEEDPESVKLLVLVMCFIGSLYAPTVASDPLEQELQAELLNRQHKADGFGVQALLLYSIAVYWSNEIERSWQIMDDAISMALDIGMNLREFASTFGGGDPVLEECWRRTWWQLYLNDMHVASSSHVSTWKTSCVATTVELPCEECEYEAKSIPKPRTLLDYENREFLSTQDDESAADFSSFAHVIGLTRSLDLALAGASRTDQEAAKRICKDADAAIAGWCSYLPQSKRELVRPDGTVDELLFKANMLIHTYIVDLHRPLSALAYSSIESVSRCGPPSPPANRSPAQIRESHAHTTKILHSIERLTELLTLPAQISLHTPFIICMIATTTIAHLSACRYVLKGRDLAMARERIRASIGALKSFEDIWALGKRTRREVGIVAREILSLGDSESQPQPPTTTMPEDFTFAQPLTHLPDLSAYSTMSTLDSYDTSEFYSFLENYSCGRVEDPMNVF